MNKFFSRFFTIIVLLTLTFSALADINDKILNDENSIAAKTIKLPTQLGVTVTADYFSKDVDDIDGELDPFFFVGPGFFFDYKISNFLTLSLEGHYLLETRKIYESSKAYRFSILSKHWINASWGYIGFGFESLFFQGVLNGRQIQHKDILFNIILTGENVNINNNYNSQGDLRFGISIYNDNNYKETRFSVQYNIGIGFKL